jgi:hypothetical protein
MRRSGVFSAAETFDLIVLDPPLRWFKPRDLAEAATADEGYSAMTSFFRQARAHLTVGGRMRIFFGPSGHGLPQTADGQGRILVGRDSAPWRRERTASPLRT